MTPGLVAREPHRGRVDAVHTCRPLCPSEPRGAYPRLLRSRDLHRVDAVRLHKAAEIIGGLFFLPIADNPQCPQPPYASALPEQSPRRGIGVTAASTPSAKTALAAFGSTCTSPTASPPCPAFNGMYLTNLDPSFAGLFNLNPTFVPFGDSTLSCGRPQISRLSTFTS